MPEHMRMSEIEILTDGGRRGRWSAAETLRIVEDAGRKGQYLGGGAPAWRGAEPALSLASPDAGGREPRPCPKMTL